MTQRLYYTDSYCTEFTAQVVAQEEVAGRPALILNQTAFYPTSGGQPHDTGTLVLAAPSGSGDTSGDAAGAREWHVVDVIDRDGQILHVLDAGSRSERDAATRASPGTWVGQSVHGAIDWPRRLDHMQQHTGQHLISQLFSANYGYETTGVHFGDVESTVDLAGAFPGEGDIPSLGDLLAQAEEAANAIIYRALSIHAYEVDGAELAQIPVRRPPRVQGKIRIVEIDKWDYSACGGTHCATTAQVGIIKFLRYERRKRGIRLVFMCGGRARADYALRQSLLAEVANLFSTDIRRTPELTAQLLAQNAQFQREIGALNAELAQATVANLLTQSTVVGDYHCLALVCEGRSADWLKAAASALQATSGTVAVLAGYVEDKSTVIVARAADVPLHAGDLLRGLLREFGGNGGGRAELAQGGGVPLAQLSALIQAAHSAVRAVLEAESAK